MRRRARGREKAGVTNDGREEVEREERPTRRRSRGIDSWPWKAGEAVEIEIEIERE